MPTIIDVAKAAGVSAMTVSRVANGKAVSPTNRKRVEDAIANLGYVPNEAAQVLARKRHHRMDHGE